MATERTRRAIAACGHWLAECLRTGWERDQLDELEALWWEHHDERGDIKTATALDDMQGRCRINGGTRDE